jgi:hypothetical protein
MRRTATVFLFCLGLAGMPKVSLACNSGQPSKPFHALELFDPAVASNGFEFLIGFGAFESDTLDNRPSTLGVRGARMGADGRLLNDQPLNLAPQLVQSYLSAMPACAMSFDGSQYLVAWVIDSADARAWTLSAMRVGTNGTPLDQSAITIASDAMDTYYNYPEVHMASGSSQSLIVWSRPSIRAVRLDASGAVMDSTPLQIAADEQPAVVASNGSDYLVVWPHHDASGNAIDIRAARVTSSGSVLDASGFVIAPLRSLPGLGNDFAVPVVASDGSDYLVAWVDYTPDRLYGARVTAGGQVLDPTPVELADTTNYTGHRPSITFGDGRYYIAWFVNVEVDAISVMTANGIAASPLVKISHQLNAYPALAFAQHEILATWIQESPAGSSTGTVVAQRFRPDWSPIDGEPKTAASGFVDYGGCSIVVRTSGSGSGDIAMLIMIGVSGVARRRRR